MLRAVVVVATISVVSAACAPGQGPAQGGRAASELPWTTLFDGTSLAAWTTTGDANWQVSGRGGGGGRGRGLSRDARVVWRFRARGRILRESRREQRRVPACANPAKPGAATCYEVNIFDQRPDPSYRTGGIVGIAKPSVRIDAGNRWNTYQIEAHGRHIVVKLNGQTTVDVEDDKLATGPIGLQYATGQVKFRSVRIRRQ